MRADFQYAAEVLSEAVARHSSPEARFEYALQARAAIREAMRAGRPPREHYRYQWLVAMTRKLLGSLSEWGMEFDGKFPQDTSTVLDFLDIVETARLNLIRQVRQMGLEPETARAEKPPEPEQQTVASDVDGEDPNDEGGQE